MGSGALYAAAARPRTLIAAVLAALVLVALTVSACLTAPAGKPAGAGSAAQATTTQATTTRATATSNHTGQHPAQEVSAVPAAAGLQGEREHQCPDHGPPVPACHNQADLQLTTHAAGPRPDADLRWDHPRFAAERAGLPGSPFEDPAPDLIALSISRT